MGFKPQGCLVTPSPAMTLLLLLTSNVIVISFVPTTKPGCQDSCGNTSIPYPFGIGSGCYRQGLEITCNGTKAMLGDSKSHIWLFNISLMEGEARIHKYIGYECYSKYGLNGYHYAFLNLDDSTYKISSRKNKFTVVGCDTLAYLMIGYDASHNLSASGCVSICYGLSGVMDNQCSGMGCCQTDIPDNLSSFEISFSENSFFNHSNVLDFNHCSYAVVAEQNSFQFKSSDLQDQNFRKRFGDGLPLVLDWVVGTENCIEAVKNKFSYACLSENSKCVNSTNGAGYLCNCSNGFKGNPYLNGGCQDINECSFPDEYPCKGDCTNTEGNYTCTCPYGTQGDDPKNKKCDIVPVNDQGVESSSKFIIGIGIGIMIILVCVFALLMECQKRKHAIDKEKYFQQNGGQLLYEELRSKQIDTVKVLTKDEIEKATNNFDRNQEVGRGGFGAVYKGTLKDGREVAVKRSKTINPNQKNEFVQEMIILSQLNHRNIVRILGCCLEVEVPILIYEFIPNGTLFQLIHKNNGDPIPLSMRLKIALQSAEALAYLHSSASPPIVHGDVKTPNILLDENFDAKVSDFGASKILPENRTQFITMVQGTLGYLDPEFLQLHQLTEKSDVYSFGVVLLELITRKLPIYSDYSCGKEGKSLASSFVAAMKEKKLREILDEQIAGEGDMGVIQEIAEVAMQCLKVKGEERPTMTRVVERLRGLRSSQREIMCNGNPV